MSKLLLGLLLLAAVATVGTIGLNRQALTTDTKTSSTTKVTIPELPDLLRSEAPAKPTNVNRKLKLEAKDTLVLRGPVSSESVGKIMRQAGEMSRRLSSSDTIYLVLDTPGGSVSDGADLIDYLEALPQKVTTVTLFAASMGFQIVENNPGERLIARNGMLMSHRATMDGLGGQFDGELETRYRMLKRKIDYLEVVDSARMGLTLDQYKAKVKDEMWVHGFDAQEAKVADAEVLLQCGESMNGTETITVNTLFGAVEVDFDKCPMIKEPVAIRMQGVRNDARQYVYKLVYEMFYDRENFIKEIIVPNKFNTVFN